MRVLIAEDDPDIASGLCASLRRQGHVVDHVDNGAHADAALVVCAHDRTPGRAAAVP